jgi:hypothetical protein
MEASAPGANRDRARASDPEIKGFISTWASLRSSLLTTPSGITRGTPPIDRDCAFCFIGGYPVQQDPGRWVGVLRCRCDAAATARSVSVRERIVRAHAGIGVGAVGCGSARLLR